MKTSVILFVYPEFRFMRQILRLRQYLRNIDCVVELHVLSANPLHTLRKLAQFVVNAKASQQSLLAYCGHGARTGWGHPGISVLPYFLIARKLCAAGRLLVINDTCYGLGLLKHLKAYRSEKNTAFITSWDGAEICYGGPVDDALQFWRESHTVEDVHPIIIHSNSERDIEVAPQFRWGTKMDHLFFP